VEARHDGEGQHQRSDRQHESKDMGGHDLRPWSSILNPVLSNQGCIAKLIVYRGIV
jgi:hypothetical protein